ncbi:MAG: hypothetical protein AB7E79_07495 [Rhodospirillaceae bacterium]
MTGIVFAPLVPLPLIVVLGAIGLALVIYGVVKRARGALLRAVPIAALLIVLSEPKLVSENQQPLKDIAVVVVDDSESQKLGARETRAAAAVEKITADLTALGDVEVRAIRAGRNDLAGGQDGTRLFGALTAEMNDIPRQRLAGVILVTDGQVHDALTPAQAKQAEAPYLNAPLHVLLTGERKETDRRIRIENAPDFGLVGKDSMVRLRVEDTTVRRGTRVPVTIRRNGGEAQNITLAAGESVNVPMAIENAGGNVFEVEVNHTPGELSAANNRAIVSINGVRDRLRVLLVSGQPHVGERAWRNLLKSDPNVDLVHFTILRPLNKDDGTPLNELSLITFPIRELFEEQINEFDLMIFDRYNQRGLIPQQFMTNIARYIENGGALLLTVGPEFASEYSLFGTQLQRLLPAEPSGRVFAGSFRPQLSPIGRRHPVTAGLGRVEGQSAGAETTWGRWLRHIQVIPEKGNAVLTGQDNEPLLILDRVGKGRIALLLSDTIWLWGKGFDGGGPQTELMRRTAHWLMKEPELEEEALSAAAAADGLTITRRSLAEKELPVTVTRPNGEEETVLPKPVEDGKFVAQMTAGTPGVYRLTDGINTTLTAVGSPNPLETYDVVTTEEKLKPLADATGGGVYWLEDATAPTIRRITSTRVAHGASWMGLVSNEQYLVTGLNQTPLAPLALLLLAVMAGAMLAWWREGR